MRKNEKGLTTIELMIALFILSIVTTASVVFYEFYDEKTRDFGAYTTARNLAVSVLETQLESTKLGDTTVGIVYQDTIYINGRKYEIVTKKSDVTDVGSYYNNRIPFYKLNTQVIFSNKSIEVNAYASTR